MITKLSTLNMPHEQWLSERRNGIGGSDAGAIIGLNPYKTSFDVYADKLQLVPDKEDNEAMRQGRDLEEYVARRFEEETRKRVRRENHILYNSDYPFAFANIDRMVIGEKAGLECKTTKCLNLKRYKNGEFPSEYYCQCMHYMMVTGLDKWYLAVLVFGAEFKVFEIERDEEEIKALAEAERTFWDKHVKKKIPPAPDGSESTNDVISAIYKDVNDDVIDLAPFEKQLKKLSDVKELIASYETQKCQIEQEIKLYMKEAEHARCTGYDVSWKAQERNDFDIHGIIRDFVPEGTDLTEYYKSTKYRVFKVKEIA